MSRLNGVRRAVDVTVLAARRWIVRWFSLATRVVARRCRAGRRGHRRSSSELLFPPYRADAQFQRAVRERGRRTPITSANSSQEGDAETCSEP